MELRADIRPVSSFCSGAGEICTAGALGMADAEGTPAKVSSAVAAKNTMLPRWRNSNIVGPLSKWDHRLSSDSYCPPVSQKIDSYSDDN